MSEERIFDLSRSFFEDRRFLPASARGEPESRLWRVFANGARRNVRAPNFWKAGVRFPVHRRSCLVNMPQLAVRRLSPPSAAAPPGLERKPGFRLSARAFNRDAAGFQRTLAHARNSRPNRETRAPAGMTGHGNAGVKKRNKTNPVKLFRPAKPEQISEEISYRKPDDFHHPSVDPESRRPNLEPSPVCAIRIQSHCPAPATASHAPLR